MTDTALTSAAHDELAARRRRDVGEVFTEPRANRVLMTITLFLIRHLGYVGLPFLRYIPGLRRLVPFVRAMDIAGVDLPAADVERVRKVQAEGAMFLAPNHPELFTDWMVDWDVTSRIAPTCAFWGGFDIVNGPLRQFWLQHNLIANTPGGGGKDFSVKAALRGDGVLIHPEGDVAFTARTLQPVFHGVADLAVRTATEDPDGRPTAIVPLVYRYRFSADATHALHERIDVLESRLGLHTTAGLTLALRWPNLHENLLAMLAREHGLAIPAGGPETYFVRQNKFITEALAQQESIYGISEGGRDVQGRIRRVQKKLRQIRRRNANGERLFVEGTRRIDGILALARFSPEAYANHTLTLEQIGETLTRLRTALVRDTWVDGLRAFMPFGCAPRRAHVRVLEPMIVPAYEGPSAERRAFVDDVLQRYAARMREGLAALDAEFAEADNARGVPNAFARDATTVNAPSVRHAAA